MSQFVKTATKDTRTVTILECENCTMSFSLHGVLENKVAGTLELIEQVRAFFCPYCGVPELKKRKSLAA